MQLGQTLMMCAAFASSTYLLSQIPGPGRSSDDDLLNPPPQTVRKVLARLKYSVPLYKAKSGFSILTEEYLTFQTVSPNPLSKGAIRAYGLSIAAMPSLPANSGPVSDDALLHLRACFLVLSCPNQ